MVWCVGEHTPDGINMIEGGAVDLDHGGTAVERF
jgi:hypothetical protein